MTPLDSGAGAHMRAADAVAMAGGAARAPRVALSALARLAGLAGLAAALLPGLARADPHACPATQQAVFSCSTGAKRIAVCASEGLSRTGGTLQYRFGRPDRVELVLPRPRDDWRAITRGATMAYSGGGGAFIAFDHPPYRYVVFTAVGKGWGSKAGVVVEKDGRRIAHLPCKGRPVSALGPELFSTAGVPEADPGQFEIP